MAHMDVDNLSPEEKAVFDAMVEEEMRKLEEQFQREANLEAQAEDDAAAKNKLPDSKSYDEGDLRRGPSSSHFDNFSEYINPHAQKKRDQNSLHPDRLTNQSRDWNNEDVIKVAPQARQYEYQSNSHVDKRLKQREYSDQLREDIITKKEQEKPYDPSFNQGISVTRSAGSQRPPLQDEMRLKKVKAQQEYAQQLRDQQAYRDTPPSQQVEKRRFSRRQSSPVEPSNILSSPTSMYTNDSSRNSALTDREKSRLKQIEYRRQLEEDRQASIHAQDANRRHDEPNQNARYERRELQNLGNNSFSSPDVGRARRRQDSPPQPSNIFSSPTSMYTAVSGRHKNDGYAPLSDREKHRQKQEEYRRQLEEDKMKSYRSDSNKRSGGLPQPRGGYEDFSRNLSENDLKYRKQQEYAEQLRQDMQYKSARGKDSSTVREQETNLGINIGREDMKSSRRQKQAEYAQQIREASEQKPIASPRVGLASRRKASSPSPYGEGATGLAIGGFATTADERAKKRERQSQYKCQLDLGANSKPIASSRAPLHSNRPRQDEELGVRGDGVGGFTSAGLIGSHEKEEVRRQRKRESQMEYFNQLKSEQQPKSQMSDSTLDRPSRVRNATDNADFPHQLPYENVDERQEFGHEAQSHSSYDRDYRKSSPSQGYGYGNVDDMKRESQYRIQSNLTSALSPMVADDGNVSLDGINPPYGRHNKGMNVPLPEGKSPRIPSTKLLQQQKEDVERHKIEVDNRRCHEERYLQENQGTGLMIGGMEASTADNRNRRAYQQEKYARELEEEKHRAPIQRDRISLLELNKYQGNGLPGSNVSQSSQPRDSRRHSNEDHSNNKAIVETSGQRGMSHGGGASSIVLGGGYDSPVMRRIGTKQDYAEQIYRQQQPHELYAEQQQYYRDNY